MTREAQSEWTIDTLKEYFERVLAEKDKAISIALAAAKEAVTVAEANAEKWRTASNEWRGAMNDRERTFATRAELQAYKEATERALAVEKERSDKGEGKSDGLQLGWALLIGAIGVVSGIIGIVYALTRPA